MSTNHFLFLVVAFLMSPFLSSNREEVMEHLHTDCGDDEGSQREFRIL
jgi:hypothetical protein